MGVQAVDVSTGRCFKHEPNFSHGEIVRHLKSDCISLYVIAGRRRAYITACRGVPLLSSTISCPSWINRPLNRDRNSAQGWQSTKLVKDKSRAVLLFSLKFCLWCLCFFWHCSVNHVFVFFKSGGCWGGRLGVLLLGCDLFLCVNTKWVLTLSFPLDWLFKHLQWLYGHEPPHKIDQSLGIECTIMTQVILQWMVTARR